eukprot:COSAG04_NODE_21448_length_373_cov_1.489051_1_plen_50_part_10
MDIERLTSRWKEHSPSHKGRGWCARQPQHDERQEVRADHPLPEAQLAERR